MVFPWVDDVPRHPSQLYQAGLEGLALFVVLWLYSSRRRPRGAVSGVFLIGYGVLRWVAEYFAAPDEGIFGFSYTVSMGQWLSLPMIVVGIIFVVTRIANASESTRRWPRREKEEKEMAEGMVVRGLRRVRTLLAEGGAARGLDGTTGAPRS
jgi:prolipoprotein diacylglyceryltransferase